MTAKKTQKRTPVRKPSTALARRSDPQADPSTPLGVIERLVKDKEVDVGKLERVIELQKDLMRVQAKAAFDSAFVAMEPSLPTITKRGKILNKDKSTRSHYARLGDDIHPFIKPILQRHGFVIRHRTEWPAPGQVKVVGILVHQQGHQETSEFEAPADTSDYRTHVQSLGSTVSYGRRYTTIDLLNLTIQGVDNDGQDGPRERSGGGARREAAPAAKFVGDDRDRKAERQAAVAHTHAASGEPITQKQRQRLWVIIRNSGRDEQEVRDWLKRRYQLDSTEGVTRDAYDGICTAIEATAALPEGRA